MVIAGVISTTVGGLFLFGMFQLSPSNVVTGVVEFSITVLTRTASGVIIAVIARVFITDKTEMQTGAQAERTSLSERTADPVLGQTEVKLVPIHVQPIKQLAAEHTRPDAPAGAAGDRTGATGGQTGPAGAPSGTDGTTDGTAEQAAALTAEQFLG